MTEEQKQKIDMLSQAQMALMWRNAPVGYPLFDGEAGDYFVKRFQELGGFTPAISRRLGWDM